MKCSIIYKIQHYLISGFVVLFLYTKYSKIYWHIPLNSGGIYVSFFLIYSLQRQFKLFFFFFFAKLTSTIIKRHKEEDPEQDEITSDNLVSIMRSFFFFTCWWFWACFKICKLNFAKVLHVIQSVPNPQSHKHRLQRKVHRWETLSRRISRWHIYNEVKDCSRK